MEVPGEPFSVDSLGRELFDKSGLFTGWPENAVLMHNVHAFAENKFNINGKIIATSLVHGGPPPVCFSRAVVDYIVFDKVRSSPDLQDILTSKFDRILRRLRARGCVYVCLF